MSHIIFSVPPKGTEMSRKVKAQGFLYVAPSNIDFSLPSHTSKKWQRRYFKLYDDGELSYGLDSVAMPATKMDMNRCIRVCEADAITGHSHSILVAFCVDDLREVSHPSRMDADELEYEPHPAVCYLKAESTDEIRWWQNNLQTYINQQTVRMEADELEYEPHPAVCYLKAESTDEIRWWQNNLQTYINQQTVYCTPSWLTTRAAGGVALVRRGAPLQKANSTRGVSTWVVGRVLRTRRHITAPYGALRTGTRIGQRP
uniref:PH domain-containing protein n=1 Tax=Steinernema glaseri TaxID=37863 RepID=A0A1I7Y602_9BILA